MIAVAWSCSTASVALHLVVGALSSVDHVELDRRAVDAALGVDLVDGELDAGEVLAVRFLLSAGAQSLNKVGDAEVILWNLPNRRISR